MNNKNKNKDYHKNKNKNIIYNIYINHNKINHIQNIIMIKCPYLKYFQDLRYKVILKCRIRN